MSTGERDQTVTTPLPSCKKVCQPDRRRLPHEPGAGLADNKLVIWATSGSHGRGRTFGIWPRTGGTPLQS